MVNKDFHYVTYFDALSLMGSTTRVSIRVRCSSHGEAVKGNTLGPKPASLIIPAQQCPATRLRE